MGWTVNTSQLLIRYNEEGLAGRSDRPHGDGPSAKLTDDEKAQLAGWVRQGPDLHDDGVGWYKPITWNRRNTNDVSQSRHQIELRSYPSVL